MPDDPKPLGNEDKFMAGMLAVFVVLFGLVGLFSLIAIFVGLWKAGFLHALLIIVISIFLFVIIRKLYHHILAKDLF